MPSTTDRGTLLLLPDALLAPESAFEASRPPRLVATGFGGSFRSSFSGSSYYLAAAGIATGTLDGGFTLYSNEHPDRGLQLRGALWKAQRALLRERRAGFKFAPEFSEHLWHRHLPALAGTDLVNNFQLYSSEVFARRAELDIRTSFYLDGTLHDYLEGYRDFDVSEVDETTTRRAIEVEREGYQQADAIAVMSRGAATTLEQVYGIDPARVSIVLPGANLDDSMVASVSAGRAERADRDQYDEFTVGFLGVYPERKGLPKLAEAIAQLRLAGVAVRLLVIGRCPEAIASMDGVQALGLIDKRTDPGRLAAALSTIDLGCQLSTVEMWGLAALEFVRCGIPVLATEVGGVPDMLPGGGTAGLPPDVGVEQVAATIQALVEDRAAYARLADGAAARSADARWERTAAALGELLAAQRG